jgi:hypothetical protein
MYKEAHKLDKLTSDDVLHQVDGVREWFLDLTENEHL